MLIIQQKSRRDFLRLGANSFMTMKDDLANRSRDIHTWYLTGRGN